MGATEIFRPTFSRVLAYAVWVVLVIIAVSGMTTGSFLTAARILMGCMCAAAFVWLFYFRPHVEVADGGITVTNPLNTIHVPWPAVEELRIRGTFEIVTTVDGRVSAFAATIANKRHDAGLAGIVREQAQIRLSALRDAGFLDDIRIEGARVRRSVHVTGIFALAIPALVLAVLFAL